MSKVKRVFGNPPRPRALAAVPPLPRRATVARVDAEAVTVEADGETWPCDVLVTSGGPALRLEVGQPVLFLPPEATDGRGCILGRVERYDPEASKRVELEADEEISLRCGESSIALKADGKVVTRGTDVVSSARRRQRIKGGSVDIN